MKFKLEPDNRGVDDEVLLDDLRRVARELGKRSLSQEEYNPVCRFHSATIKNRIGWNRALVMAGLVERKTAIISADDFLEDLRQVAAKLETTFVTVERYRQFGKYSDKPVKRLFGTWGAALKQAGLTPLRDYSVRVPDDELYRNLEAVWRTLGRQPKREDMKQPLSTVGPSAFNRRFGSWRKALESFVVYVNGIGSEDARPSDPVSDTALTCNSAAKTVQLPNRNSSRAVSWRLRFLVMRRDDFRCRFCGLSPATTPGMTLVIDHVLPWSKGGETAFENLQTLCEKCNGERAI